MSAPRIVETNSKRKVKSIGMMKKIKSEKGMIIVEASFVFPIMFIILLIVIYMGNVFYLKAQVEKIVTENAIKGAAYAANPLLEFYKENGALPGYSQVETEPYRYLFGGMNDVETIIAEDVVAEIESCPTVFAGMRPDIRTMQGNIAKYNNVVVYATFSVEVEYDIKLPIRLLGDSNPIVMKISSRADVPVSDTPEFIRNTDMVIDLIKGTKVETFIADAFGKISDFLSNFKK